MDSYFAECISDGPVLTMMNKRLRALKKKYNRILLIEENKAQGKPINKEQEEVLKSKTSVSVLIEEYEKLRQPLSVAVKEELAAKEKVWRKQVEGAKESEGHSDNEAGNVVQLETESSRPPSPLSGGGKVVVEGDRKQDVISGVEESTVADLLKLLYFAQLFDLRVHGDTCPLVLKVHERSSCLSYDFVTEDSANPLKESDLDALAFFGVSLTSRPPNSTMSHMDSLQLCIRRAVLWLQKAEPATGDDLDISYSYLRERLNRILSSDYFTMTPELKTLSTVRQESAAAVATAAGQHAPQFLIHNTSVNDNAVDLVGSAMLIANQDCPSDQVHFEAGESQSIPGTKQIDSNETGDAPLIHERDCNDLQAQASFTNSPNMEEGDVPGHTEEAVDQYEDEASHVNNVSIGPRGFQGMKGGGRGYHGHGGRGRGYMNGRGRGGRGLYGNVRGWLYYDQAGYYPRNQYGRGGGRSVRGGGSSNFNAAYSNGQVARITMNVAG